MVSTGLRRNSNVSETVFEKLHHAFGLDRERPHQLDGFQTRLAAKAALHNFCIWLNRQQGRPSLAFVDLLGWWHHLFHTKCFSGCIHHVDKEYHNTRYCTNSLTDRAVSRR